MQVQYSRLEWLLLLFHLKAAFHLQVLGYLFLLLYSISLITTPKKAIFFPPSLLSNIALLLLSFPGVKGRLFRLLSSVLISKLFSSSSFSKKRMKPRRPGEKR